MLPVPEPGPGELVVAILCASICGSDLHTVHGRRAERTPCVLGHEAVGRVVALGPGRDPELLGRRITWSLADSCGQCPACLQWDLPQKCVRLFKYGHAPVGDGSGLNGCYASHVVLRAGTSLVPVPDNVSDAMAAPANCALATMVAATEPLTVPGNLAVIQGAGLLGIYGCVLLRSFGWRRVMVVDRNPRRLGLVTEFGGEAVPLDAAAGIPSASADAVLEVCGDSGVVSEGIRLLRPGGHYGFVGMVHPDSPLPLTGEDIIRKCVTIRGIHNYAPRHLQEGVRFLGRRAAEFPWDRLTSPPMALGDLEAALQSAAGGDWLRVCLRPDSEM